MYIHTIHTFTHTNKKNSHMKFYKLQKAAVD
jgi:hypothetical protein